MNGKNDVIRIQHFTKDYGAGKSTTIRHLMEFSRPQKGSVCIENMDCWNEHKQNCMVSKERPAAVNKKTLAISIPIYYNNF